MYRTDRVVIVAVALMIVPVLVPGASADPVVVDRFDGGVEEAELNFTHALLNDTLAIRLPRGARIQSAEMTLDGIGGTSVASSYLNFTGGTVGVNVWAYWNEGRGLYPLKIDPRNHGWSKATQQDISGIEKVDNLVWGLDTQDRQAGKPPGSYPIQLFRFKPQSAGADNITVSWHGFSHCTMNKTHPYHAEMWLYDHKGKVWDEATDYTDNNQNVTWMNHTIDLPSVYLAADGSIDVAIVGSRSQWAGPMIPAFDNGHLRSDFIGVRVESGGGLQYPSDVVLSIEDQEVAALEGNLTSPVTVGDAHDLASDLQSALDGHLVKPGNVSLTCYFSVGRTTAGRLHVGGLRVVYEPVVNAPPSYVGPPLVEVEEDSPWTPVLDLDAAFDDDHNRGNLTFLMPEFVDPPFAGPPYPVGMRFGTDPSGNRTLEVQPERDFFTLGPLNLSIQAMDLFEATVEGHFQMNVTPTADAPRLEEQPNLEAHERTPFNHTFAVSDPDLPDDVMTFSDDSPHFDIDPSTGEVGWTPGPDQIGAHEFHVTVTDRYDLTDRILAKITVRNSNDPPVITSELEVDGVQDQEVVYTIRAEDPDVPYGDVLRYRAFADAIEFDIDAGTGRMAFTPTNDHVPRFNITIIVEDQLGEEDEVVLWVNVENVNDPPAFTDVDTTQTHDQNTQVDLLLTVVDPDLSIPGIETLTFSGTGPGTLLPDEDGLVSFKAGQSLVGQHQATYTVTDVGGLSDVITITWEIVDVNDDPVITTGFPASMLEDEPFTITLEAEDPDGDAIAWEDDSDLFDIDAGSGLVEFTPTQAHLGEHTVTFSAGDGRGGLAEMVATFTVENVNDEPVITEVAPASGASFEEGEGIPFSAVAIDEDGDPLTFTWREGDRVVASGMAATVDDLSPGEHTITLVVEDGNGGSATQEVRVEVASTYGSSSMLLGLLLVVVLVVVGAALYLRSRGRTGGPPEDMAEEPPEDTAEEPPEGPGGEVEVTYESAGALEYPGEEPPTGLGEPQDVDDGIVHDVEPDEEEIYQLEDAPVYEPEAGPERED